jgi:hypothetical protein
MMSTYKFSDARKEKARETPAIWRGLGCLLMIIIPIISYAAAVVTVQSVYVNRPALIPRDLLFTVEVPRLVWQYLPILAGFLQKIFNDPYLWVYLMVTVVYLLIFSGIISVAYSALFRAFGPPQYGRLDAPPVRKKAKKYVR